MVRVLKSLNAQESTQVFAGDANGKVVSWDLGANATQGNQIAQVELDFSGDL